MADRISVLIVDDIAETRDHLAKLLGFESDIEVVGTATSGAEALEVAARLLPNVVLMDINMPGQDGIATTEQLTLRVPTAAVVMMSVQGEADYLRRSMLAGAREFLVKPFSGDELVAAVRQVFRHELEKLARLPGLAAAAASAANEASAPKGRIITVFSPKGGVGRTTVAVNVAVAAAGKLGKSVVLVDGSFQFGDVGVLLNLPPKSQTIADLIPELTAGELESLDSVLVKHASGLKVLLAPPTPETAELITTPYLRQVLERLRDIFDLVIVDSWPWFQETTLGLLDLSDEIIALLTLELTNIKNMRLFLEVADQLGYEPSKIRLVLNRADTALGIRIADVERSLGRRVEETIVSDGRTVVSSLNRGVPFVLDARDSQVSRDLARLAQLLVEGPPKASPAPEPQVQRKSLLAWR
ncbi:MAG TPA: response regulator [Candidatus Limnocylindrales bacterium]|jgi:pilus assembly protein CpaE|nr:response regulator [Candidatus Limnocylindrales bacterium]